MSIITEITESHTPVEVIPVLTADNFKDIKSRFDEYPLPATVAEEDFTTTNVPNFAYLNNYDKITLADGTPTNWYVDTETLKLQIRGFLPCSVVNCDGHTLAELDEESWDDIYHELYKVPLPETEFGIQPTSGGTIYLQKRNEGCIASFYFTGEGDLALDDLDDLVEHLQQTITAVQKFKETATGVALATAKEFKAASILESEFVDEK